MKTNIIHILIIAILLIAGWSLFTILQDFNNSNPDNYDNYSMIGKTKQYLPEAPASYTSQRKYPVYKGSNQLSNQNTNRNVNYSANKMSGVSTGNSKINSVGGMTGESGQSFSRSEKQPDGNNTDIKRPGMGVSQMATPFSKNMKINTERDLAVASNTKSISGSSLSGGSGMMKVFGGGDDQGDDLEGGGGNENENFYNDVPVGEGYYILIFMSVLYLLYKMRKKFNKNLLDNK